MADTKISALPASTTPLAGTEVLPIVQSSTTKQVSVANLTAGRTFEALGVTLTSTDAGATAAPTIDLYRDSATPAASDTLGEIEFNGEDSAGNKQAYGLIHASILSPTSTAEQGQLHFETATAGALTEKMIIGTSNLVINEIGAVFNVRIEGDTDANLFYTDATNSRVGIGTASPAVLLEVAGTGRFSRSGAATQYITFITDSASNRIVSEGTSKVLQIVNNNVTSGGISFDNLNPSSYIFSQGGTEKMRFDASANLGIGTTANASAILDVQSTTKGVRMPNMTTGQKNAISTPPAGLMVFDTTLAKLCVYSGAAWETITSI